MPMDVEAIRKLDGPALESYLWRRLRLEPPLDPPLGFRFAEEAPEQIVIDAWQNGADAAFGQRLVEAIRSNLARLAPAVAHLDGDGVAREQLASLAFLAGAIRASELGAELGVFAADLWSRCKTGNTALQTPLYHTLKALCGLQGESTHTPLWLDILEQAPDAGLRAIACLGLCRSDSTAALARFDRIVADKQIQRLPEFRKLIRDALAEAGADCVMLAEFDENAPPTNPSPSPSAS
jgi:hypothetical protein